MLFAILPAAVAFHGPASLLAPSVGRTVAPVAIEMAPPAGFEWGIDLTGNIPKDDPAAAPAVVSWFDAGTRGDVVWPPSKVDGPAPEPAAPPASVESWYDSGLRLEPEAPAAPAVAVESWYDSGLRLEPEAPVAPAVAVESWYDAGLRLTWPSLGGKGGPHRMNGTLKAAKAAPKPKEWPSLGGKGGPHRMNGTLKAAKAAVAPTVEVQGKVVPTAGVGSWYDAGVRL